MFKPKISIVPWCFAKTTNLFTECFSFQLSWSDVISVYVVWCFTRLINFMLLDSQWQPTPVLLPGKSHGQRSLVGSSPWGREESDTTERPHFHFSLLCIGEGNGNPLQCSCLENPRDGRAWWAAVYWVARSRTRLKRVSSSSSNVILLLRNPLPGNSKQIQRSLNVEIKMRL